MLNMTKADETENEADMGAVIKRQSKIMMKGIHKDFGLLINLINS